MNFIAIEICSSGELFDLICHGGAFSEPVARHFFKQFMSGLKHCHDGGVSHRDLKPENLLLDFDNTLKIVDFGLSNMYEKNETLKTACGSPCYAAPEVRIHFWLDSLAIVLANSDGFFLSLMFNLTFTFS